MQILCVKGGEMLASNEKGGIELQRSKEVGKCNALNPKNRKLQSTTS